MTRATHHLDFSWIESRLTLDIGGCRVYPGSDDQDSDAPAWIFVPGGYHGAWCFSHYLQFFAGLGVRAYAVDLPGHGALAHELRPDLDIDTLADALVACARVLSRRMILVGHSVGALPVMLAAMELQPAGLVLLAPSPPGNLPGAVGLPPVAAQELKTAPAAEEVRNRFLAMGTETNVDQITRRLRPESPAVLNDRYALRIRIDPARIACPGICLEAGLDDGARHPAGQDLAIAEFLGLQHKRLEHQPHCMMYGQDWKESAEVLLAWYQHTFGSSRPTLA